MSLKSLNTLKTDPLLPKTFPYLATENLKSLFPTILLAETKSLSEQSFVAPYKFIGAQALSVDNATTFLPCHYVLQHLSNFGHL